MPDDLVEIFDTLKNVMSEVHSGAITPAQASAMATVAGALIKVLEAGELTVRVAELEQITCENRVSSRHK